MAPKKYPEIENSIIKIVGLLEETPGTQSILERNGYVQEVISPENSVFLKDYFYPDFRNLMFYRHSKVNNRRYRKEINQNIQLSILSGTEEIRIKNAEVYLFGSNYIALFCITIQAVNQNHQIKNLSGILNIVRQFDALTEDKSKWYNWIENEILGGIKIRGQGISVDEYSGSKFKLFTVVDLDQSVSIEERTTLLYDLGTSSPLGSASDSSMPFSPHPGFYSEIMKNKLSVFNNWELLSLLDTFTVVGNGILTGPNQFETWNFTYYRIYLFRVFFKYNLNRYNSLMSYDEKIVALRAEYEEFLNIFDTFPISYNFLPNEIFQQIGTGLNVQHELKEFHQRITRMSEMIKEKKQELMNLLLALISVLSAIASAAAIPEIINQINEITGISAILYFAFLTLIFIIMIVLLFRFLKPVRRIRSFFNLKSGRKSR